MSQTLNWSSTPKDGNVHGKYNLVEIKNGKGVKTARTLNAKGKTIKKRTRTLKRSEVKDILRGQFVPGLWNNCKLSGTCTRRRTRK